MLKTTPAGFLLAGAIITSTLGADLRIEQFAPDSSVIVVSMQGGTALLDRIRNSSAQELLQERMDAFHEDYATDLPEALSSLIESMNEDENMLELLLSLEGGMALSVESDPESYAAVPNMLGFINLGSHAETFKDSLDEQFETMEKEGELVDIAGKECIFLPAADELPVGGGGFGLDFSILTDMDSYVLRKDQLVLFSSSMEGMRSAIEASEGEDVADALVDTDQWEALKDTITIAGPRITLLTEHLGALVSAMDSSGRAGMMGGMATAAIGRIDGIVLGLEPGKGESIFNMRGGLWMPEGKTGLIGLLSENTERGQPPTFFETDQLSIGRMNVRFSAVMDWIRSVIRSNPMLQMAMMQGFQQVEPIMTTMMDSLGETVYMAGSLSRPIEADSLQSIYAIECEDTQKFNDSFGMLSSDMGMDQRDFQGHQVYVMEGGGGMLTGAMGMGGGSTAIALGGSYVFVGDVKGVEECLRNIGREDAAMPAGLKAGMAFMPDRSVAGWGVNDYFENMKNRLEVNRINMESALDDLAEDDPDLAEEIRAEMREERKGADEEVQKLARSFGPITWSWWSNESGFLMELNLLEAEESGD